MDAEEGRENKRVNLRLHLLLREILLEILSRLPITSLIHFKTTSHAGCNLIADPTLPPMFRNRLSDSDPCLILNHHSICVCRLYFLDGEGCSRGVRKIDPPQHSELADQKKRRKKQHSEFYILVGSCNGLLCLSFPKYRSLSESHRLLIYNPFVGDAVRVPPANRLLNQREVFGFGFHPRTGEFKVVRIVCYEMDEELDEDLYMVQVFTVGTTKWREKGAPPPYVTDEIGPPKALVEGSLHWVTDVRVEGVGLVSPIISFELADEGFEEIPHPPCQPFASRKYGLSVLNGCLSVSGLVDDTLHLDIWVMKQYRVKESWVKQFSFHPYFVGGRPSFSRVICALKNGEILLQNVDGRSLVSYDPVENRFKTLQISGLTHWFKAFLFLPSLFSAKATMNLQL